MNVNENFSQFITPFAIIPILSFQWQQEETKKKLKLFNGISYLYTAHTFYYMRMCISCYHFTSSCLWNSKKKDVWCKKIDKKDWKERLGNFLDLNREIWARFKYFLNKFLRIVDNFQMIYFFKKFNPIPKKDISLSVKQFYYDSIVSATVVSSPCGVKSSTTANNEERENFFLVAAADFRDLLRCKRSYRVSHVKREKESLSLLSPFVGIIFTN
jgi:hypothetical protein